MTPPFTARLALGTGDPRTAARLRYAFAAYAALHGIHVVRDGPADVVVGHGPGVEADVALAAGYRPRAPTVPAPEPTWVDGMPSFHRSPGGAPDLLGEVFEWLAAPHERACTDLDDIGRVPPGHGLAGTHGLDLRIPWANRWLARLHAAVRAAVPRLPAPPPSPFGAPFTFVASHDLDHLSGARAANARRVVENAAIALLKRRDVRTAAQIVGAAVRRTAARVPTADGVADLLAGEAERGVRSSYTVVAESTHPRDPGYRLDDAYVTDVLDAIAGAGHELAVHGSYRSLDRPGQLAREYAMLGEAGRAVSGGRQHWLRHRGPELYEALVGSGATWDSTAGYPDHVGYRNGAAFPYPPYDLDREEPFPIVEIPLVVMERALCTETADPAAWPRVATDVLRAAGDDGWGGVAVLWHDSAFTGTALPARLADAYWAVLDAGDRWVTGAEMARAARARWDAAGAFAVPHPIP